MFYVFFYAMYIKLFSSFSCLMLSLFSAVKRLMKEAAELKDPTDHYHAQPLEVCFSICLQEFVIRQFYSYILLINMYFSKMHVYLKCTYLNDRKLIFFFPVMEISSRIQLQWCCSSKLLVKVLNNSFLHCT